MRMSDTLTASVISAPEINMYDYIKRGEKIIDNIGNEWRALIHDFDPESSFMNCIREHGRSYLYADSPICVIREFPYIFRKFKPLEARSWKFDSYTAVAKFVAANEGMLIHKCIHRKDLGTFLLRYFSCGSRKRPYRFSRLMFWVNKKFFFLKTAYGAR